MRWLRILPATTSTLLYTTDPTISSTQDCSVITGVSVPMNEEKQQTMAFLNEACSTVTVRGMAYKKAPGMVTDSTLSDLRAYLARPVMYQSGTIMASSTSPFLTIQYSWPPDISRLSGCFGFRATLVFRLQVAAPPFAAGRLRMVWLPEISTLDNLRLSSRVTMSQLPGVELDYAEQTSVVFRIPYIHQLDYIPYEFVSTVAIGSLSILSYLGPSLASGSQVPTYTLWHHLEDIEIIGTAASSTIAYTTQAGDVSSSEGAALSTALTAASRVATVIGDAFPLISSYTGMASWMARAAAHAAASFGWSKPIVVPAITRVNHTANIYQHNDDAADPVFSLGLAAENAIIPLPGFAGSDVDEMAISTIAAVPSAFKFFNFVIADGYWTPKFVTQVCPMAFYLAATPNTVTVPDPNAYTVTATSPISLFPTPIFALANVFDFWRGTLIFRFKVAKTRFHAGRYMVVFQPDVSQVTTLVTATTFVGPVSGTTVNCRTAVWDLREANTLDFEVPFQFPELWAGVYTSIGRVMVFCLEGLLAPSVVAPIAPVAVEVFSTDMVFASPSNPDYMPSGLLPPTFLAQAGNIVCVTKDCQAESTCMGEAIRSIKQLIMRAALLTQVTGPFRYSHWWANISLTVYPTSTTTTPVEQPLYAYFAFFYAYARGGTCFDVVPTATATTAPNLYGPAVAIRGIDRHLNTLPGVTEPLPNGLHAKLPYQMSQSRVKLFPQGAGLTLPITTRTTNNTAYIGSSGAPVAPRAFVFRRAADDSQLGYFLSTVPFDIPTMADNPITVSFNAYINGYGVNATHPSDSGELIEAP
jgi:hypothetical protein